MKKLFLIAGLMIGLNLYTQAQSADKPFALNLGLEGALPLGSFGETHDFGFGGSLQGEYKPAEDLGLTLNAGYVTFSKETDSNNKSFGLVPVLAGAKYYIAKSNAYIHGQLGIGIPTDKDEESAFMYSPGIGYMISEKVDILAKYIGLSNKGEDTGSRNAIGVRIGYNF
ncbi:MAG: outer membrane beta-barrel protein [Segetibacter sp.]|nr:outer membrane beta-barrel protein [Segetibacter sp.]